MLLSILSCSGYGDICTATVGDLAGTYDLQTGVREMCSCTTGDCHADCEALIGKGAECYGESCVLENLNLPMRIMIASDGSGTLAQGAATQRNEMSCRSPQPALCALELECQQPSEGQNITSINMRRK